MLAKAVSEYKLVFLSRNQVQAWIFLFLWPLLNLTILTSATYFLGTFTWQTFAEAAVKMWMIFSVSYFLFNGLESLFKTSITRLFGRHVWLFRPLLIVVFFFGFSPIVDMPGEPSSPAARVMPTVVILLEVVIYSAVMLILKQQESFFQARLQQQKAELQVLKMQSNPHFLFNTLNLIANEVTRQPIRAKELIYNLSDLLRDTVKLAGKQWSTIEEELRLVELYLLLQQKRFEDRLTFDVDCPNELDRYLIPSLLLLPVVENAIKHGVAPYAKAAHISIHVKTENDIMVIEVLDTGEPFIDETIQHGEGLRILYETLRLHFDSAFSVSLKSSSEGASLLMSFPDNK